MQEELIKHCKYVPKQVMKVYTFNICSNIDERHSYVTCIHSYIIIFVKYGITYGKKNQI